MYNMGYMSYSNNPYLPRLRMQAVNLVRNQGWSIRQSARYVGVHPSTVMRWCAKAERLHANIRSIPTQSSSPKSQPNALNLGIVKRIVAIREERGRCAEIVHKQILKEGYSVCLSSVKRTLDRYGLTKKRSPWKKYHAYAERPEVASVGDLVEIDTIHFLNYDQKTKFFVYTLLDVFSRWAWAEALAVVNTNNSIRFVHEAQAQAPFSFRQMQSDHGSEFSTFFSTNVGPTHRHIRIRSPNENGHIERFNRTIQEECLRRVPRTVASFKKTLPEYLHYYNNERMHLGIDFQTPLELIKCCEAAD